jgi:hypothetical protein
MISGQIKNIVSVVNSTIDVFFYKEQQKKTAITWLFLLVLYLFGIFLWGKFFNWGKTPLDFLDWAQITLPRLDFIQDALRYHEVPMHMLETASLHYITDRFFTLPDVISTPQMILLSFLSINQFIFFDVILSYSFGFLSLLWFFRKFKLSILAFTFLFFLFNFNGYILSHYSVGHFTWGGYYLFPAFFALMIRYIEGESGWLWVSKVSFLLFYMVLAGSQHHFVWLLIFMGLLMLTSWHRAKWLLISILSSGLLSAVRLLPPILELNKYQNSQAFNAVYGYPSFAHFLYSIFFVQTSFNSPIQNFPLNIFFENYWEFNFFVGLVGGMFILYFGIYSWLKERQTQYQPFILPALFLVALSFDSFYWIIRLTNIPIFASERASMRIIGAPMVLFILLASIFFEQKWHGKIRTTSEKTVAIAAITYMFIDLWSNLTIWRPGEIRLHYPVLLVNLSGNSIANHSDPQYTIIMITGLVITIFTAIFLLTMSIGVKRKQSM